MDDSSPTQATWTEGVCGDGAVILHDGVPAPISGILASLNAGERAFQRWIAELERLRSKPIAEDPEHYRAIFEAGEEPQTVIDEWGVEP